MLPQLPKAQKSLPSLKGSGESHKVSESLGVNGMYHLHWGHDGFANGDSPLSDEMYERLRELSKRKDWWILGGRRTQVTQSHNIVFFFLPFPPSTRTSQRSCNGGGPHPIKRTGRALLHTVKWRCQILSHTHFTMVRNARAEREGRWKKDNDSHGVEGKVGKV